MDAQKDKILVIGDWFMDENWLMAKTSNYNSTDVGDAHYNSQIEGPANFVLSVCGVASVLKILSGDGTLDDLQINEEINKRYDLIGVGAWNPRDTEIIQRILCAENPREKFMTPYTLANDLQSFVNDCPNAEKIAPPSPYEPGGMGDIKAPPPKCTHCKHKKYELINMVEDTPESQEAISTNRIYRVYEGFGSQKPRLRYRFDWQIDLDNTHIKEQWTNDLKNTKAVIVVDHGKGVITPELIDYLLEHCKEANWYVRNKLKSPQWFKRLNKAGKRLKLLVIDQQLVNHTHGLRTWERKGKLCRASLELLGELLGVGTYHHGEPKQPESVGADNVAVLFENNCAIGASRIPGDDTAKIKDARIYYFPRRTEKERHIRVGRTSIFFNSLIYWDLMMEKDLGTPIKVDENGSRGLDSDETQLSLATTWALRNMEEWMDACTNAWDQGLDQALSGPFSKVLGWHSVANHIKEQGIKGEDYARSWDKWNFSSKDQGVIKRGDGNDEFHLWRSYGTLNDYVCPGGVKRSQINDLVRSLSIYHKDSKPKIPFNTLLVAEPGWGKSFLAFCLSRYFDFHYLSYSIAQMSSTKELVDSFKEISSMQKQSEKKCLVFMDEIDAEISGNTALGLLLSPMWDGLFKSEGYTNKIDPCVWIFAGTKSKDEILHLPKGRDFISRINGPIIDIDFLDDAARAKVREAEPREQDRQKELIDAIRDLKRGEERRTEIVYQTVNLLNREYDPIMEIEREVLELFSNILPLNGIRSLRIFVSRFKNVKKGIIRRENVPLLLGNPEMEKQIKVIDEKKYKAGILSSLEADGALENGTVKIKLDVVS